MSTVLIGLAASIAGVLGAMLWRARRALRATQARLDAQHQDLAALAAGQAGDRELSNRRIDALVFSARQVAFEIDEQGRVVGQFGTAIAGWGPGELEGRDSFSIVHPADRPLVERRLVDYLRTGVPVEPFEVRGQHADGSYRWYEVTGESYSDADGEHRILIVCRDIEERKSSELALMLSESRYRAMVDQSPFAVLLVDAQLDVVLVNAAYADLVGAPSVEALRDHNLWKSPAMTAKGVEALIQQVGAGESLSTELSYTSSFDKQVEARAYVAPLSAETGEVAGAQILFEDISESRRLEEQLRRSQKMEAVGRLAGGIAHDFNNFLTVILACGDAVCATTEPESEPHEAGEQIVEVAERCGALTRRLLAFSRRHAARPEQIEVADVVERLEPMLHRLLGETIDVSCTRRGSVPNIWFDPALLEQVIVNLAMNARDAMPQGGSLSIEVRGGDALTGQDSLPNAALELVVRDSGVGMDEATRSRVFEPFFTTKGEAQGTGLGLSTVYGIVKQSGGQVDLESSPGEGTTVRILLPVGEGSVEHAPAVERVEAAEKPGRDRILLVEDEDMLRNLASRILTRAGYTVVEARDGEDALEIARRLEEPIDLLLTDVVMPRMSGTRLVAQLRAERPDLRVLFMSGYAESVISAEGGLPADSEILNKPFSVQQLRDRVRQVLERGRKG